MVLSNNVAEEVELERVEVTDPDTEEFRTWEGDLEIGVGSTEVVEFLGIEETGGCHTYEVEIVYDLDTIENQVSTGTVTTSAGLAEIEEPGSPGALIVEQ